MRPVGTLCRARCHHHFGVRFLLSQERAEHPQGRAAQRELQGDLAKDLIGRFALTKTIARPDYSALGGAVSLDDTNLTGNGGNPNLKPIRATNLTPPVEYYFAPRSLVSFGLFHIDLNNYVSYGVSQASYFNEQQKAFRNYNISSPVNSKARSRASSWATSKASVVGSARWPTTPTPTARNKAASSWWATARTRTTWRPTSRTTG